MNNYKFKIEGLDCAACASSLEEELSKINIISNVSISFMAEKLSFDCDESNIEDAIKQIKKVIKESEEDVTLEEL